MTCSLPFRSRASNPSRPVEAPASLVLLVTRAVDRDRTETIARADIGTDLVAARSFALRALSRMAHVPGAAVEVVDARTNAPLLIIAAAEGGAS